MITFRNMPEAQKPLHVSIRQVGVHFRVLYQRQYPNAMEEVLYSERFKKLDAGGHAIDRRGLGMGYNARNDEIRDIQQ